MKYLKLSVLLICLLLVSACAAFLPRFETPIVTVASVRILPGQSLVPVFAIDLDVSNPNRIPLQLAGLSYHLEIEGHRVISGVAGQLPQIAAYGQGRVSLEARPDLLNTLSLFHELLQRPRQSFSYELDAVLDVGRLIPKIHVGKQGTLQFSGE